MKTLKELAQAAIDAQNACNLSGVVHSFSRAVTALRALPECEGTDWVNSHPVCVMFASKIASLTGCESAATFSGAYGRCVTMAAVK